MIKIKVEKNVVSVQETEPLYAGAAQVHTCEFAFDTGWERFAKSAVFRVGGKSITILIGEDHCCELPWELLVRSNVGSEIEVGVYGVSAEQSVLTSVWDSIGTVRSGVELGEDARKPSDEIYRQVMATTKRMETAISESEATSKSLVQRAETAYMMAKNAAISSGTSADNAKSAASAARTAEVFAEQANRTANEANERSGTAISTAEHAFTAAENAMNTADTANHYARDAVSAANNAIEEARNAASDARSAASDAAAVEREARNAARDAASSASDARDAANNAVSAANDASEARRYADSANTTANNAYTKAQRAESSAEVAATRAEEASGKVPKIGDNNTWWIGDTDTGVPATGAKGDAGNPGVYTLGAGETIADAPSWADVVVDPNADPAEVEMVVAFEDGSTTTYKLFGEAVTE